MGRGFTITARALISDPRLFLQSVELGTIARVEGGEAMMAVVAEVYRQKTGHDDAAFRTMSRFLRAMTAQNRLAMTATGAQVAQAFADKGTVLRGVLSQIRRRRAVDLKDPTSRLRIDLSVKFGTLYLSGARPQVRQLIRDSRFFAHRIEPLAEPDSQKWLAMLQASVYGALERSYTGHPEIFRGRDCLDRSIDWGLSLKLYRSDEKKSRPGESVHFYPFQRRAGAGDWIADSGGIRLAFNEYTVSGEIPVDTIEMTSDDLRRAKRKAHDFLRANPELRRLRIRWLRAVKAHENEACHEYFSKLAEAFRFQSRLTELQGSELGQNPDLFLLHQFLKEIVWVKFGKWILTFATNSNSGR